jgi:putative two-component system response regulator
MDIHVKLKNIQKQIERDNEALDTLVLQKTRELLATRSITIHALVGLLEVRNVESCNHTLRTQKMMGTLCRHLRGKEGFCDVLTDSYIDDLIATTPLHDIGKVGIPDRILLKPDRLTAEEFELMKKHVDFGVDALKTNFTAMTSSQPSSKPQSSLSVPTMKNTTGQVTHLDSKAKVSRCRAG